MSVVNDFSVAIVEGQGQDICQLRSKLEDVLAEKRGTALEADLIASIGKTFVLEGDMLQARDCFSKLPLTGANIESYLSTFVQKAQFKELLAARDEILQKVNGKAAQGYVHEIVDRLVNAIAMLPSVINTQLKRYADNLRCMQEIDPYMSEALRKQEVQKSNRDIIRAGDTILWKEKGEWSVAVAPYPHIQDVNIFGDGKSIFIVWDSCKDVVDFLPSMQFCSFIIQKKQCIISVDLQRLALIMSVVDFSGMLDCDYKFAFLNSNDVHNELHRVFREKEALFPNYAFYSTSEAHVFYKEVVEPFFSQINDQYNADVARLEGLIAQYYGQDFASTIPAKIADKTLRIVLRTSRFTTFLQYSVRDLSEAFQKLGFQTFILQERAHGACGVRYDVLMKKFYDFKPDVYVDVNHLRYEESWIPHTLPHIAWIQDKMEQVLDGRYLEKISRNDILLSQTFYEELLAVGYRDVTRFPVPVNENYFHGEPSGVEYLYDITYINHAPIPLAHMTEDAALNAEKSEEIRLALGDLVDESGDAIITLEDYKKALQGLVDAEESSEYSFELIRDTIGNYIQRTIVLDWLMDAGVSFALFGKRWEDNPQYCIYAKGELQHGQELAGIYNKSKINLHMHPYTTTHQRIFESIASGGFMLVRHIDPHKDMNPLMQYLDEGEGFIYFYDQDDLVEKVKFYLSHDDERIDILKRGQKRVTESYTYQVRTQLILDILAERFTD